MKTNFIRTTFLAAFMVIVASSSYGQWSVIGNAGTNPPTNFIGTTDAKDLILKANNSEGLRVSSLTTGPRVTLTQPSQGMVGSSVLQLVNGVNVMKFYDFGYGFSNIISATGYYANNNVFTVALSGHTTIGSPSYSWMGGLTVWGATSSFKGGLSVGGTATFSSTVGIGTTNPLSKFQVSNGINKVNIGDAYTVASNYGIGYIGFNAAKNSTGWVFNNDGANNGGAAIMSSVGGDIRFFSEASTGAADKTISETDFMSRQKMVILSNGRVGIGTNAPGSFHLAVEGKIGAREVQVLVGPGWPDFVFEDNYKLKPLSEVEKYVRTNRHLEGIPSASEVSEKGGIELGAMQAQLLEKVETITLYLIELKKENEVMKAKIEALESNKLK